MSNTVLAVEDNDMFARIYQALFTSMGCRVLRARTRAEALRLIESERPDLILMDIRLPDGSGLDAIRTIRGISGFETTPIVTISTRAVGPEAEAAEAAGSTAVLAKPVAVEDLAALARRYLSGAKG